MGFFDSIKSALGGGKSQEAETVKGPSMVLREAGIDPSGLDFQFGGDGSVTVTGRVADAGTRERITEVVSGIEQVSSVNNQVEVGPDPAPQSVPEPEPVQPPPASEAAAEPETPAAEVAAEVEPEPATPSPEPPVASPAAESGQSYTVQPGDSLWKIAEAHYGDGTKYQAIFEANRDILDNPDLIHPGQELKLPEL